MTKQKALREALISTGNTKSIMLNSLILLESLDQPGRKRELFLHACWDNGIARARDTWKAYRGLINA